MPQIAWVDWIGYAASVLILISFLTSSIIRLRLINLAGCAVFATYGFIIHSIPTGVMNLAVAGINIYFLIKLFRKKEQFTIVPALKGSPYLTYFLDFYRKDIGRFYPDFNFRIEDDEISFYILRDMATAGLFVGKLSDPRTMIIRLDYAIPAYRDMKVGRYLYSDAAKFSGHTDISRLMVYPKDVTNRKYFVAMGFAEDQGYPGALIRMIGS